VSGLSISLRIVAVVGGGFGLTSAAVMVTAALLARWGMAGSEAVVCAALAGLLLYPGLLLWGLAEHRPARLYCGLGGFAAALAAVWWVLA